MTAKTKTGGLAYNPLESDTPRGVDGLIRSTAQDAHDAQQEQTEQKAPETQKAQKAPRINMAFSRDNLDYLHIMAGFEGVSVTEYVNRLVKADRETRRELLDRINLLKGDK